MKCPECGATTRANADLVVCTYCGTESRVQRRTQVLQRPIELPPAGLHQPRAIALERRSRTGLRLGIVALVAGATLLPVILSAVTAQPTGRAVTVGPSSETWETGHPLLVDLDGDGVEDAIGIARYTGRRDEMHLRAVAGATGKTLWESPSLGTYLEAYQSTLALADGIVLFAETDRKPHLEAYDAKTGARKWSITPAEVVKDLCRDQAGRVRLVTKDEAETSIDLATGAAAPVTTKAKCIALPNTLRPSDSLGDTNNRHWGFAPPGMKTDQLAGDPSSWILTGYKYPGTDIPMLAAIDDHERVLWKTELASHDALTSKRLINQIVAFDATLVTTVYGRSNDKQPPVLVAFDRATGARRFETPLQTGTTELIMGVNLVLGPTTAWVYLGTSLQAYDRKTGALRWRAP